MRLCLSTTSLVLLVLLSVLGGAAAQPGPTTNVTCDRSCMYSGPGEGIGYVFVSFQKKN